MYARTSILIWHFEGNLETHIVLVIMSLVDNDPSCNRFLRSFLSHKNVHLDNGAMNKAQPHKGARIMWTKELGSSSTLAPEGAGGDDVMIIARYRKGISTPSLCEGIGP